MVMGTLHGIGDAFKFIGEQSATFTNLQMEMTEANLKFGEVTQKANDYALALSGTTDAAMKGISVFGTYTSSMDDVLKKSEAAIVMSNISGQNIEETSNDIMAAQQQFAMGANDSMKIVDVYASVARQMQVDYPKAIQSLSEGVKRSGGIANEAGISYEKLTAIISTLVDKTRLGGAELGNTVKTVTSRFQRFGEETDPETFENLEKSLYDVGISMKTIEGNAIPVDQVLGELAGKWDTLSDAQKNHIAQLGAGGFQVSKFLVLMSNWGDVETKYAAALDSSGVAMQKNQIFADSLQGSINRLKGEWEKFYLSVMSPENIKLWVDVADGMMKVANNTGTLITVLTALGGVVTGLAIKAMIPLILQFGYFIGTIGVATSVTEGFLFAINAMGGPIIWIATALGLLVGVCINYSRAQEEAYKKSIDFAGALQTQSTEAQTLISSLDDLANTTNLTNVEQQRIKESTDSLIKMYPILAGKIDGTTASAKDLAQAYKYAAEMAKYKSSMEATAYENVQRTAYSEALATEKEDTAKLLQPGYERLHPGEAMVSSSKADIAKKKWEDAIAARQAVDAINITVPQYESAKATSGGTSGGGVGSKTGTSGGTSSKETKEKTEDILDSYKAQQKAIASVSSELTILNSKLSLAEGDDRITAQNAIIDATKRHQQALKDYNDQLRLIKNPTEEVTAEMTKNSEAWWSDQVAIKSATDAIKGYNEEAKKLLEETLSDEIDKTSKAFDKMSDVIDKSQETYEARMDKRIQKYQDELDALKAKNDELDDEAERQKMLLEIEEARDKLANVKAEKNVQLYTGVGSTGFEWVADPSAVADATEALSDLETQLAEYDVEKAQTAAEEKLQAKIDALEDEKSAEVQKFQERKEALESFQTVIEEKIAAHEVVTDTMMQEYRDLLTSKEQSSYATRLEDLQEFVDSYNDILDDMGGSSSGGGSSKLSANWSPSSGNTITSTKNSTTEHFSNGGSYTETYADGAEKGFTSKGLALLHDNELVINPEQQANIGSYIQQVATGKLPSFTSTSSTSGGDTYSIANITLPNVQNAQDFATEMKSFIVQSNRFSKSRG